MSPDPSPTPLLAVLGATGTQGGAVLRHLARHHRDAYRLRGLTRDPTSSSSQALAGLGVEMVAADLGDEASLRRALAGATHLFANTDSNQLIYAALKRQRESQGSTSVSDEGEGPESVTAHAAGIELGYGRNLIAAAVATESLRRIVWSGLPGPRKWSQGRLTAVSMFDVKQEIADRMWATPGVGEKLSVLMIGFYADNALKVPALYAPREQSDGVYELAFPMVGDAPVPIADVEADTGRWVHALFQAEPGITLLGVTETLSWAEWVRLWGEHNRVPTRYRQACTEEFAPDMKELKQALVEEFRFVEEYGFTGGNPQVVDPDMLRQRGIALDQRSIVDHIRRSDWTSTLQFARCQNS